MTDFPLLRRIFRQDPNYMDNFYIHGFLFEFAGADDNVDISTMIFRATILE